MNALLSPSPSPQPRYRVLAGHLLSNLALAQLRQALARLAGDTADIWVLGPAEEADVVLLPRGVPMPPVVPPVRLVWVDAPEQAAAPGAGQGCSLCEPFEAAALLALLRDVECRQPARRRQAGAPSWHRHRPPEAAVAPGGEVSADVSVAAVAVVPDARPVSSAMLVVPEAAEPSPPQATRTPPWWAGSHLYRLRRWPAPGSLVRHRYLPRLASLLLSRSLSLSGLAALSNVGEAECEDFLAEMDRQGLLSCLTDDEPAATDPATAAPAEAAAPVDPQGRTAPRGNGWVARLRARWSTTG